MSDTSNRANRSNARPGRAGSVRLWVSTGNGSPNENRATCGTRTRSRKSRGGIPFGSHTFEIAGNSRSKRCIHSSAISVFLITGPARQQRDDDQLSPTAGEITSRLLGGGDDLHPAGKRLVVRGED